MTADTTTAYDPDACRHCDATAAGCRLRVFVGGKPCCPDCTHDARGRGAPDV